MVDKLGYAPRCRFLLTGNLSQAEIVLCSQMRTQVAPLRNTGHEAAGSAAKEKRPSYDGRQTRICTRCRFLLTGNLSQAEIVLRSQMRTQVALLRNTGHKAASSAAKEKRPSYDGLFSLAAELGFEPRHTESESAVLPLHNSAKLLRLIILSHKKMFVKPFWEFCVYFCFLFAFLLNCQFFLLFV